MQPAKIMLIRHAEKPTQGAAGVSQEGQADPHDLTVRGWQRAGALVRLFSPVGGLPLRAGLATPDAIFASAVNEASKSSRPQHTIVPLSELLNLNPHVEFGKGDAQELALKLVAMRGNILVCWQHEDIPAIANAILRNDGECPQQWPGERFDVVWVFDRTATDGWDFSQVPQLVLPGDFNTVIQ